MAGIGFELRRQLRKDTWTGFLGAYALAGVVASGPWIVSIGSMLLIGVLGPFFGLHDGSVAVFLATVTQLIAWSLVVSGLLQHLFTRFVADRAFEERNDRVAPNLMGALLVTFVGSGAIAATIVALFLRERLLFGALAGSAFAILSATWVLTVVLSGMKRYGLLLASFAGGYGTTVVAALALARFGAEGYLAGFCIGQGAMLVGMLALVVGELPSDRVLAFEFLRRKGVHPELALTGLLFNLAIWADKAVFWIAPQTSRAVLGPIRASVIYDVPLFAAYLSVIPGMAALLVRIETDFAEKFSEFFSAVREGAPLSELVRMRDDVVGTARAAIHDVFRVQGLAILTLVLAAPYVLDVLGIPRFYLHLFRIDVVGAGLQVVFLGALTILFYLDYRKLVAWLTGLFLVANVSLSVVSLHLGPRYYGLGFVIAAAIASFGAIVALTHKLSRLEYETFMR